MGQIFPTASFHRDHSILYALVCEKELSHMCKNNKNPDLVCEKIWLCFITMHILMFHISLFHDRLLLNGYWYLLYAYFCKYKSTAQTKYSVGTE